MPSDDLLNNLSFAGFHRTTRSGFRRAITLDQPHRYRRIDDREDTTPGVMSDGLVAFPLFLLCLPTRVIAVGLGLGVMDGAFRIGADPS